MEELIITPTIVINNYLMYCMGIIWTEMLVNLRSPLRIFDLEIMTVLELFQSCLRHSFNFVELFLKCTCVYLGLYQSCSRIFVPDIML